MSSLRADHVCSTCISIEYLLDHPDYYPDPLVVPLNAMQHATSRGGWLDLIVSQWLALIDMPGYPGPVAKYVASDGKILDEDAVKCLRREDPK